MSDEEDTNLFFQLVDPRAMIARTKRSFNQSNAATVVGVDEIRRVVKEELAPIVEQCEKKKNRYLIFFILFNMIIVNLILKKNSNSTDVVAVAPPIAPKRKYQKKPKVVVPPALMIVKEEAAEGVVAAEKPREVLPDEPPMDARSARKFRAQIKAGDHYLIHSHSLSH